MMRRRREEAEMNKTNGGTARSDALVLFGVTGDLAHKKIFPALYAMAKQGALNVPVVGVASSKWSLVQLRKHAEDGIRKSGRIDDQPALRRLLSLLRYVDGDYNDPGTFKALNIDSWRWEGVPWYLRSGKCLAATAAEVLVELKPPPQRLFDDSAPVAGRANYLRFRLSPNSAVALAARVKRAGKEFAGDQRELYLLDEQPGEETPYERLLGDAMAGDGALFTGEDAVEAAWAVVDPVLNTHHRARPYKPCSWGPKQADALIAADGSWHNPILAKAGK
jgi:glucose-6-phosphate 1-dehydrogenase